MTLEQLERKREEIIHLFLFLFTYDFEGKIKRNEVFVFTNLSQKIQSQLTRKLEEEEEGVKD